MDVTVVGLRVVREVARRGSITAAATALGYTQSAVSRQVAATESAVGQALFTRRARGVVPTAAGEILTRHADAVLRRLGEAGQELAGLRDRLAGRLAVDGFPIAHASLLPRAVALLRQEHPALAVALSEHSTPAQLRRLRAGRTQVAVVAAGDELPDYDLSGLHAESLPPRSLQVAVPDAHHLTGRVTPQDLRHEPWIVGRGAPEDPQFGAWPTLTEPHIAHTTTSWQARLGYVAAGLGLSLLPALAAPVVPAGVRVVDVDDPRHRPRTTLLLTGNQPTPAAEAMLTALRRAADTL
ncbi:LysR family transcriptional regulator [Pseudonocardia xishanensis]|uniref:LysR family transcriptional regulator n=1 Tax=Pseudonocardia xishanensis TaxID=630995 RepID=A0ABP8S271_9PSEU